MSTVIVYESMFGNTRRVAEAIADGLRRMAPVDVVRVADAAPATAWADVVILGAPTHAWSLSRPATRASAADTADRPRSTVRLEPDAQRVGLREWVDGNIALPHAAVTFDTRVRGLGGAFGHASHALDRRLRRRGVRVLESRSFFVDRKNELLPGELDRAVAWGAELAGLLSVDGRQAVAEFAVGFYGSAGSLRALRWAAGVGIRWPASLRIVTVHDGTDSGNAESIADTAVRQLTEWARRRSRRLVA